MTVDRDHPYGRGKNFWCAPLSKFFPPSEPLSGCVAAFLVRVDETRLLFGRSIELDAKTRELGHPTLEDADLQYFMALRHGAVAAHDAAKLVGRMMGEPRFGETIRGDPLLWAEFKAGNSELAAAMAALDFVRNKLGGHFDPDAIQTALRDMGEEFTGGVWLGESEGDCSYDAAHLALVLAAVGAAKKGTSADRPQDVLASVYTTCAAAQAALFRLRAPILLTFARLTGAFFPTHFVRMLGVSPQSGGGGKRL